MAPQILLEGTTRNATLGEPRYARRQLAHAQRRGARAPADRTLAPARREPGGHPGRRDRRDVPRPSRCRDGDRSGDRRPLPGPRRRIRRGRLHHAPGRPPDPARAPASPLLSFAWWSRVVKPLPVGLRSLTGAGGGG